MHDVDLSDGDDDGSLVVGLGFVGIYDCMLELTLLVWHITENSSNLWQFWWQVKLNRFSNSRIQFFFLLLTRNINSRLFSGIQQVYPEVLFF